MFFIKLRTKIAEYFRRRFYPFIFDLNEEYDDILSKKEEIELRNVLIGTIRRREQYSVNVSSKFYHIPTKQILDDVGIEYVALYQSRSIFNKEDDVNGVLKFARVIESTHVKRCDIKEIASSSNEEYIKFDVERWNSLSKSITIREKYPKVFSKTSFYLLTHANSTCELYFESVNEYVFYLGLCDIIQDLYDGFEFCGMIAIRRGRKIIIKTSYRKIKIKIKVFLKAPHDTTHNIFTFFDQTT